MKDDKPRFVLTVEKGGKKRESRVRKGAVFFNRSLDAHKANTDVSNRATHKNGPHYDTETTLLRIDDLRGVPQGMIHWFGVHPTNFGNEFTLVTGDNKGMASQFFENKYGTDYQSDDTFVAAFAQANCGDTSANARGYPKKPVTTEELNQKFLRCAERAIPEASANKALHYIQNLSDEGFSVGNLVAMLVGTETYEEERSS